MINVEEVVVDNETVDVNESINNIINIVNSGILKEDIKKILLTNVKDLLALLEEPVDNDEVNNNNTNDDEVLFDSPFNIFRKKEKSENSLDRFQQIVDSRSA